MSEPVLNPNTPFPETPESTQKKSSPSSPSKRLVLIDGSGFIFRAYHALPPLRRPDGTPVGAVYGFCNMLVKFMEQSRQSTPDTPLQGAVQRDDYLAVIFDAGRKTFRQDIYPAYKAHRPDTPEDLIPQFSIIREVCEAFNVPSIELEGYEADDLLASYAREAKSRDMETLVVSSDKDLMQLINDHVSLYDPLKNKPIGPKEVFEKFGVFPEKVIDVQALAGDSTDNVPGVPGIGVKTAAELINTYGSLESLLERAGEIKQPKRRESLVQNAELARISKQLVTLCETAPLPQDIDQLGLREPDTIQMKDFLRIQGFASLSARLDKLFQTTAVEADSDSYETIQTKEQLVALVKECTAASVISFDCETTSLNAMEARLVGVSLSYAKGQGAYIPLTHIISKDAKPQLDLQFVLDQLKPVLTDPSILKIGHNLKYDLVVLAKYGVEITPVGDTMLMSYVLDGSRHGHGMDELAERHFGHNTIKFSDVAGSGKTQKTFDQVEIDVATRYAAEDADITLRLYNHLLPRLVTEKMMTVYERIERPLTQVIADMEVAGIRIDSQLLFDLGQRFGTEMTVLERKIYELAGHAFNVGSPKQLGTVLFEELKMPAPKKSKMGAYVTDVDVLEKLVAEGYELPKVVLEWRGLAKLKSTYVDGLLTAVKPKSQRIHTSYSMAQTSTGRLSSSEPNLQNIPVRTETGRLIRQAFIAPPGHKLMSLDYSQIELRLLAHMADVPQLAKAFREGHDIHASTASEMFGIPLAEITPDVRRRAKAINFGIIYGISAFGLSQQLGIPRDEAGKYIQTYFERYPGIPDYMETQKTFAREHGYVKTLFGRKCYALGIQDSNAAMRQFAERQAINAPLQGSNADIIKMAMHRVGPCLQENSLGAKMLLQVHDELIFEVPEDELDKTSKVLKKLMEGIVFLNVPLVVGVGVGDNWDQAH